MVSGMIEGKRKNSYDTTQEREKILDRNLSSPLNFGL